ncbi:paraquat-inducible protein A, partial [Aliarcobacter cryaerophilus]
MQDLTNTVECYSCGLFVQKNVSSNFTQRCPRCDSKLKDENNHSIDSLFFAISSLMLFLILCLY